MHFEIKWLNLEVKEDMLNMTCRSMRDNILFSNVHEHKDEDKEQVLKHFLRERMDTVDISY